MTFSTLGALLAALSLATVASAQTRTLYTFNQTSLPAGVVANAVTLTPTTGGLKVEYQPAAWPNVAFTPDKPWDWSDSGALSMEITNPEKEAVPFNVRVDDDPKSDGVTHCRTGSAVIEPGTTATYVLPFGASQNPMDYGMRGLPGAPGTRTISANGSGPFDPHHVYTFQIFLASPTKTRTLLVRKLGLQPYRMSLDNIVDKYGQYTGAEWPGKVHQDSDLAARRKAEEADLAKNPVLPDRDRFGGWSKGPKLKATGFFRTEKVNGKWWLVDPDGRLFFSMGIDCVGTDTLTVTTGREKMFSWLPAKGDRLAKYAGHVGYTFAGPVKQGDTYNFLAANLDRKYGPDWEPGWLPLAYQRMASWGFNTLGNWSDSRAYRNGKMPYVASGGVEGSHARLTSGNDYWGQMHDPFDPQFAKDVAASLKDLASQVKGDPFCLGYFIDNELSWGGYGDDKSRYGLAYGALIAPASQPAKQAFLAQLKAKYGDIAKLNTSWGTQFKDWSGLDAPYKPADTNDAMKADLSAFVKSLALRYFGTVRDELKRLDPDHLYLGCRFATYSPEAVAAAAETIDVVSFNIYKPRVDAEAYGFTATLNKPCIIGEFHFGALDRGMFHPGLVATPNQQARAEMYRDYVGSVLDNPAFVGCQWFQYIDEPTTGRYWDGENYNIGFLNVTDTPYPEMVAAARQIHGEAYGRRFGTK